MDRQKDGWMDILIDMCKWMAGQTERWMDGWIY